MSDNIDEARLTLPKNTTPTWEMELLISGATTYALTQVFAASGQWFLALEIALNNGALTTVLYPLQLYARIVLMCLTGAFLLHLAARAYWVGLLGLYSVFNGPPDLSKIKYGPIQKRAMQWSREDIPAQIERADNRATQIFGFGTGMALMMATPILLMLLSLGIALILDTWLPTLAAVNWAFAIVLIPIMLLLVTPSIIDQTMGARISAESRIGKAMHQAFVLLDRLSINTSGNLLTMYLFSQAGSNRRAQLFSMLVGMILSILAFIGLPQTERMSNTSTVGSEYEISDYASERRGRLEYYRKPYIAAPQVRGDYLEINVPVPNKTPSGNSACSKNDSATQFTACLKRELRITLDDKPVPAQWLLMAKQSEQPATLRAMLDVRELPRGAHQLRIEYPFDRKHQKDAWVELIHFWK